MIFTGSRLWWDGLKKFKKIDFFCLLETLILFETGVENTWDQEAILNTYEKWERQMTHVTMFFFYPTALIYIIKHMPGGNKKRHF